MGQGTHYSFHACDDVGASVLPVGWRLDRGSAAVRPHVIGEVVVVGVGGRLGRRQRWKDEQAEDQVADLQVNLGMRGHGAKRQNYTVRAAAG